VTTVVMGNCGFTLAPARPEHRDEIMRMFARVEGMSYNALKGGLDWRWESFPQYLRRLEEVRLGVNVGTMVGHSAVRRYVMGQAAKERPAEADEVQQMKAAVREALAAGAFGFTTSLSPTHPDWDGRPVPSRYAANDEVIELGSTLREFGVGSIEIITKTAVRGREFSQEDRELMTALALRSGRPINWNELNQSAERPGVWKTQMEFMEQANRRGAQVYAVARCTRLDTNFTLRVLSFFEPWPAWKDVLGKPLPEARRLLADPQVRAAMRREIDEYDARAPEWRRFGKLAMVRSKTGRLAHHEKMTLEQIGQKLGKHPADALIDLSLEEDLETEFAQIGRANGDPEAVKQIIRGPYSLAGISDAGAHTDRLSGSYFSTYMLAHWVRDEKAIPLEDAVRRLTSMPASLYGISDRGLLQEGKAGDVVVFDLEKLDWLPTERFNDFPGGEGRLANRAKGYEHLVVAGEAVYDHGRHTGALPGKLLRSGDYRNGA